MTNFKPSSQNITKEYLLVLHCLKPPGDRNDNNLSTKTEEVDWDFLLKILASTNTTALFSQQLKKRYTGTLPNHIAKQLSSQLLFTYQRNLYLTGFLLQTLKNMTQEGIGCLPFKGPVLAQAAYGSIGLRNFGDLDLLIAAKDLQKTLCYFRKEGFTIFPPLSPAQLLSFVRHEDSISLSNRENSVAIDLHWDMSGRYLKNPLTLATFLSRTTHIKLSGRAIDCLAPEERILYLCVHGAKHLWIGMEWVVSLTWLLKDNEKTQDNLNWQEMLDRSEQWQCRRMLFLGLFLAHDMFKASLPEHILQKIAGDATTISLRKQVTQNLLQSHTRKAARIQEERFSFFHLKVRDTFLDRIRYLLQLLFCPTYKEYQTWPLPAGLTFLYYFYRPLRLGWEWCKN